MPLSHGVTGSRSRRAAARGGPCWSGLDTGSVVMKWFASTRAVSREFLPGPMRVAPSAVTFHEAEVCRSLETLGRMTGHVSAASTALVAGGPHWFVGDNWLAWVDRS